MVAWIVLIPFDGTMPKSCLVLYDVDHATGFDNKATTRTVSVNVNCMIIQHFQKDFYSMMDNELISNPKMMEDYLAVDLLNGVKCYVRLGVGKKKPRRLSVESSHFKGLISYRRMECNLLTSANNK